MNKIVKWIKGEPVRTTLYSLIVAGAGYALARGYVQVTDVEFIVTVAALVLGVERTRAKVSPVE